MRGSDMETLETIVPAPTFASLPEPKSRWRSFSVGFLVQVLLIVFCAETTISFMAPVLKPIDTRDNVHLVAPQLSPRPPEPEPVTQARVPVIRPKLDVQVPKETPPPIELPKPKVEVANVTPPKLPVPAVKTNTFHSPEPVPEPKLPRTVVSTNFSGSAAPVTTNKPARQVQTGGFGDPNGVPANANSTGKGRSIAKVGSFDLPGGPGTGNGSGGAKGERGTVASVGFGGGIATPIEGSPGTGAQGKVRPTNFGSIDVNPTDVPKRQVATAASKDTPVSLLSKPSPSYTLEARQRKIEGDVELEVEFTATGQVRVLRVLQGLGYGLDESAVKAAENIRFSPARRDGQAIDSRGRLRIVFRLS